MAVISENIQYAPDVYGMQLFDVAAAEPGQFVMVRPVQGVNRLDPFLPRPFCVFDCEPEQRSIRLLYQVKGRGTALLSQMKMGDTLDVSGPYGNGFLLPDGDVTLVGGGLGIAPLLLLARRLREAQPARKITIYLGYSGQGFCEQFFAQYADTLHVRLGGYITDYVEFGVQNTYFACGPEPMLRAAFQKARKSGAVLYVSLERRMGCGVGACFACSIPTAKGNRRVCKDGPVFLAEEVFPDA